MPTESGRESAAERKERQAAEDQAAAECVSAKELATTGVVLRLRPQAIDGRIEIGEAVDPQSGDLVEIPLMVLHLGIPGSMISVEFPAAAVPRVAHEMIEAWKLHKLTADAPAVAVATSAADIQKAASAAEAAERLRGGDQHG